MKRSIRPASRPANPATLWLGLLALTLLLGATAPQAQAAAPSASLPTTIAKTGVIRVATYAGFPPLEYHAEGNREIVGMEIDLARAIAADLGVSVTFTDTPFEGIIPGLLAKRYDMAITDMSDTTKREQEVDFVDYATAFSSIIVAKGNPHHINSLADLCGLPIGTQQSSLQLQLLTGQSQQCVSAGKPPIKISQFPSEAQLELELKTGRTVAQVRDFALGSYEAEHSEGILEVVSTGSGPARVGAPGLVGIAVLKGNTELANAIKGALERLKQSGKYAAIFAKYGLDASMIGEFTINGGAK